MPTVEERVLRQEKVRRRKRGKEGKKREEEREKERGEGEVKKRGKKRGKKREPRCSPVTNSNTKWVGGPFIIRITLFLYINNKF